LRFDARPQARRRVDLVFGAPQESDRPFLLGESVGEHRRRGDFRLELGAAFGRKRSVRERRELGDPAGVGLFLATPSQPHDGLHGTAGGECV
jgi:hypothetical protein